MQQCYRSVICQFLSTFCIPNRWPKKYGWKCFYCQFHVNCVSMFWAYLITVFGEDIDTRRDSRWDLPQILEIVSTNMNDHMNIFHVIFFFRFSNEKFVENFKNNSVNICFLNLSNTCKYFLDIILFELLQMRYWYFFQIRKMIGLANTAY